MWDSFFKKKKPAVSGVSILLLQRPLERFSTERLNIAMQRGWRRQYDPQKFYALSIFDGEGATVKFESAFFTILHVDRWLDPQELGDRELPEWAIHSGHSRFEYKCPGGVPEGELRQKMYGFMGLLCAELITSQTVAIYFVEEHVLVQNNEALSKQLRSGEPLSPAALAWKVNSLNN
jgi:hypothetical protein